MNSIIIILTILHILLKALTDNYTLRVHYYVSKLHLNPFAYSGGLTPVFVSLIKISNWIINLILCYLYYLATNIWLAAIIMTIIYFVVVYFSSKVSNLIHPYLLNLIKKDFKNVINKDNDPETQIELNKIFEESN